MASRIFYDRAKSLEREPVSLFVKFTLGASGAVASTNRAKGVTSVTKESAAGLYTITLQDKYNELLGFSGIIENAAGVPISGNSNTGMIQFGMPTTVLTDVQAGTIQVQLSAPTSDADATPVASNAASGDVVRLMFVLANSGV